MAYFATASLSATAARPTLSSAQLRWCRGQHAAAAAPPSALPAFPSAFPACIRAIKPRRLRRSRAAAVSAGFDATVFRDAAAAALVIGGGYALVSTFDNLTRSGIIERVVFLCNFLLAYVCSNVRTEVEQEVSAHLVGVVVFGVLADLQISTSMGARYFASLVPSLNCLKLLVNGLSMMADERLIKSVTREGKPEELLRGPLYYVIVLIVCTVVFWRNSPVGMISLAMMCGGDGIADIVGRQFGSMKLPYNPHKSWAGSMSMFLFGFLVSVCMLYYFATLGYLHLEWTQTIERVALTAFVATVVESLPITRLVDDNISVPLATMVTASLVFAN